MSFTHLPTEILAEIFQEVAHLSGKAGRHHRGLVNLSACSHWIHALVEPILYATYQESTQTTLKFLRTVLDYPNLAAQVKQFKGHDRGKRYVDDYASSLHSGYEAWELKSSIRLNLVRVNPDERVTDAWLRTIFEEDWDATTALTLLCLPQLRHLQLDLSGLQERVILNGAGIFPDVVEFQPTYYGWIQHLLRWAALNHSQNQQQLDSASSPTSFISLPLSNLTHITIRTFSQIGHGLSLPDLLPFLQLPSVQTLQLEECHLQHCISIMRSPPALLSLNTTSITLRNSSIEPAQLAAILALCPYLTRFHYQHFSVTRLFEANGVAWAVLGNGGRERGSRLRELVLCDPSEFCSGGGGSEGVDDDEEGWHPKTMASFAGLRELEVLDVVAFDQWLETPRSSWSAAAVEGADLLLRPMVELVPTSLRKLTLRQATRETLLHVAGLFSECGSSGSMYPSQVRAPVSKLESVKLVFAEDFIEVDEYWGECRALAELGRRRGVRVVLERGGGGGVLDFVREEEEEEEEEERVAWEVYNGYYESGRLEGVERRKDS